MSKASKSQDQQTVEDWLMRNDSLFLKALTDELKRLEGIIREELRRDNYRRIHVDLEPW